jgi:acyl-CoA synthetase (AMP-forming)/AMP-acid ligase II
MMTEAMGLSIAEVQTSLARHYYERGYWSEDGLWSSFEAVVARDPEHIAFVDGDRAIPFAELSHEARQFGRAARSCGLASGDIVVIHGRHCIEAVVAMLGCWYADLVIALVPPMFSPRNVASILKNTRSPLVIGLGEPNDLERVREAARDQGVEHRVVGDWNKPESGEYGWKQFMQCGVNDAPHPKPRLADELAMLIFSSGTTGVPKGVMHSANTARYSARSYADLHQVAPGDVCLIVLEFGFVASSILGVLVPLLKGCTGVLQRHWSATGTLDLIQKHRASHIFLMPTHAIDILSSEQLNETDCSSVRRGVVAGLTEENRMDAKKRLCAMPFPMYGMSESPAHVTGMMSDSWESLRSSEGRPLPGAEVRICDDDGNELPAGVKGNVLVRGPNRFLGYFKDSELTRKSLTGDGFFRTGDIGFVDAEGYMSFVSRSKDIIRRGGVTVVPSEVEAALRPHPRLSDVTVIAVPDDRLGERTCACVITRDGRGIELEELTHFLEQHSHARYMWPEYVYVCRSFPRTPSLKVKKNELRDEVLASMPELKR